MVAGNKSLLAGIVAASTLFASNFVIKRYLSKRLWARRLVNGEPVPVIYNSTLIFSNIEKIGLNENDILEGIRERGYSSVDQVRLAMYEVDGTISVLPKEQPAGQEGAS